MPINNFSDNVPRWLSIAELKIDYYTQFIKSWIPFNAWYMVSYYDETLNRKSDRDIIDYIKNNSNPFRARIINLLNGNDNVSNQFKFFLGQLHLQLEGHTVPDDDNKLTFTAINITRNSNTNHSIPFRNLIYKTTYNVTAPRGTNRIKCEIFDTRRGNANIYLDEFSDWSMNEFLNRPNYITLATERKEKLRLCFEEINPKKPENIIVKPVRDRLDNFQAPSRSITIDKDTNVYFIDDVQLVSKVIIEMLYKLRCILFHGEINPTETNQGIYEHAYNIQKILIQELR